MHPELGSLIQYLYPDATFFTDYIVQDRLDGNGPILVWWNLPTPPPTPDELHTIALSPEFLAWNTPEAFASRSQEVARITDIVRASVDVALKNAGVVVDGVVK